MQKTLQVAVNPHIVNKAEANQGWILTHQFENVSITINELADHINQGHAFCAQHQKQHRKSSNFTCSDVLAVDIDQGMRIEDALAHPFVKQYAAIIYTTPSHTPEQHRFRIVFQTERAIVEGDEMRMAYQGLIRKFGGDGSCKDACRLFYGSKDSNPLVLGNVLSNDKLDEIIALGIETKISDRVCGDTGKSGEIAARRSEVPLEKDQMVELARGGFAPLAELTRMTSIRCPVHTDFRPSAFVVTNKHGINGVHCRKCAATFWPPSELRRKAEPYNFYETEEIIRGQDYYQTPANVYDPDDVDAPDNLLDELPGERTSHVISSRFLPALPLHEGVTFIQSPKGSGKSERLTEIVAECKKRGISVLLVGHRQTLLQSMAKRLGLICYMYTEAGKIKNNQPEDYYAICIDSIGKLLKPDHHHYEVILCDESEQVFSHLTADTLKGKRRTCYMKLFHYLRSAKSVIFADADLGPITIESVYQAMGDVPYQFYLNEYKESRCDFLAYEDGAHLSQVMIEAIRSGGRHFVTTNSKSKAEVLHQAIQEEFGDARKTILVTSGTTSDDTVLEFVNNIKTEILNYDVVITSPTLGTGIDITFDDQAQLIDTVFGFFEPKVNTHFDIDQQLARVRHPKAIKVWVSPNRYGFETNSDVIRMEVLDSSALNDVLIGYEHDGTASLDETYLSVYARVMAMNRASKNNLRQNLLDLRRRNGWQVKEVKSDSGDARNGKELIEQAKGVLEAKRVKEICNATKITYDDYDDLRRKMDKGGRLTKDEELSMRRHEIESFYRDEISPDLIALDNRGTYRQQVRMMHLYLSPLSHLADKANAERAAAHFAPDMSNAPLKKMLLHDLLNAAGLADEWTPIKSDVILSKETLRDFAIACQKNASKIEQEFGLYVRKDLSKKTIRQLSDVLDLIGLKLGPATRRNGTYCYELDRASWETAQCIVKKRMAEIVKRTPEMDFSTPAQKAKKARGRANSLY